MIFGEQSPVDKWFNYWLDIVIHAYGTYDTMIEKDVQTEKYYRLKMNDESLSGFEYDLQDYCQKFQAALEDVLSNIYNKFDKLNYLVRFQAEARAAEGLLVDRETGIWHHRHFVFLLDEKQVLDQMPVVDETHFQEFYYLMDRSLKKVTIYLDTVRQNILGVDQKDILLPVSMLENANSSTVEQPIAFFDWFYTRGGLAIIRQKFISDTLKEGSYFDEAKEERRWEEPIDDDYMEFKSKKLLFSDELEELLVKELDKSNQVISNHVDRQQSYSATELRLQFLLSSLDYFLQVANSNPLYLRYATCAAVIENLQKYIYGKYKAFVPKETRDSGQKKLVPTAGVAVKGNRVQSFSIRIESKEIIIEKIFNLLIDNSLIAKDTDRAQVQKAFDGSELSKPLNIKWILESRNGKVNKVILIYLMDRLAVEKIIWEDTNNAQFLERVAMIFCDGKGMQLRNLGVSNSSAGRFKEANLRDRQKINALVAKLAGVQV